MEVAYPNKERCRPRQVLVFFRVYTEETSWGLAKWHEIFTNCMYLEIFLIEHFSGKIIIHTQLHSFENMIQWE